MKSRRGIKEWMQKNKMLALLHRLGFAEDLEKNDCLLSGLRVG